METPAKLINISVNTWEELTEEYVLATMALREVAVQPTNATAAKPDSQKNYYGRVETRLPGANFALKGHGIPVEVGVTIIWSELKATLKDQKARIAQKAATIRTRLARDLEIAKRYGVDLGNSAGEEGE